MKDHPVGTLVVPTASVSVRRNYDYDFLSDSSSDLNGPAYKVSRPVSPLRPASPFSSIISRILGCCRSRASSLRKLALLALMIV